MIQFTTTARGNLGSGKVQLLSQLYFDLQERAQNQLARVFNASCSTCIRDTFTLFSSWYLRTKADIEAAAVQEQVIEIVTDIIKRKRRKNNERTIYKMV